jgi:hypothetical protein
VGSFAGDMASTQTSDAFIFVDPFKLKQNGFVICEVLEVCWQLSRVQMHVAFDDWQSEVFRE